MDGCPGRWVYGKGRHPDSVHSSHAFTAWRSAHKWVVIAVLIKFPFAARRWALPVLIALYRTSEVSRAEGTRHRTPAQLMCWLLPCCSACSLTVRSWSPAIPVKAQCRTRRAKRWTRPLSS